ncbi:MAG: hypothetical protein Kow0069_10400 [Promethearchaeota archaeon]
MIGYNLICSTQQRFVEDARAELQFLAESFLNLDVVTKSFKYPGLFLGKVSGNPKILTRGLRDALTNGEFTVQFLLKVVPIDAFVETDLEFLPVHVVPLVEERMSPGEDYKIHLRRRSVDVAGTAVVESVAAAIPDHFNVNLEKPRWIIWLEIFHRHTGIALLQGGDIFKAFPARTNRP